MGYLVKFQTETAYKSIKYGQGTVYSSACGCASLCNVLSVLGIAEVSVPDMCKYSVSVGARVAGGTDEQTLLKHASKKYNFTYRTTSKNAELVKHLKNGGAAILHAGDSYKLFSNSGHFVAAVSVSGDTITVLDSYWYSGKYVSTNLRRQNVKVIAKGVIQTSLTQCGKATMDRSPSYYLIDKKGCDTNDMTDKQVYELIEKAAEEKANKAVSSWAKKAFEMATEAGVLDGTKPQAPMTREQFASVLYKMGLIHVDNSPSDWAKDAFDAATKAGILDGTNPKGYVTREMMAVILDSLNLIKD